jgi:N6-adenosine-specific RNA methylase IME4
MSMHDIYGFALPPIADDAWLFLWRVASMPTEALTTVMVWGFVPKAEIVWVKTTALGNPAMGMGRSVRNCHETCIIATRGRPKRRDAGVLSMFTAPRGKHSEKPEEFYSIVERLCEGPYAEVFARRARAGWACYGNDVDGEDVPVARDHERSTEHRLVAIDGVPIETHPFLPTSNGADPDADTAVLEIDPRQREIMAICPHRLLEVVNGISTCTKCGAVVP